MASSVQDPPASALRKTCKPQVRGSVTSSASSSAPYVKRPWPTATSSQGRLGAVWHVRL